MKIELKQLGDSLQLDLNKLNPDQVKELADKLQFGMVVSLLESVNRLDSEVESISSMKDRLVTYINTKLTLDIESETLDYDQALEMFSKFSAYGINVAEVKRKVFNGKDLLKVDPLTKQERAMMDLLRTINTPEKKQKLVEFIGSMDDFEQDDDGVSDEDLS